MKTRHYIPLLLFPFIFITPTCRPVVQEKKQEDKPGILTSRVEISELQLPVRSSGMLASKTQSNLSFMTGGVIRKINIREGSEVKKGQLLAELDMTEIGAKVNQAVLAMEKTLRDYDRVKSLFEDSVATLENLQDIETSVELARSNYRIAKFNQDYSRIIAPADGKILKKLKEVNEITAPGHPVFIFASMETGWVLKTSLSDRDVVRVSTGDSASIVFDAYPGREFPARVMEIADAANLLNGTFGIEMILEDLPERLVTGLIGSATIYPPKLTYPLVPYISLLEASGSNAWVYVIENGQAIRREIQIMAITDEGVFIKKGLQHGDTIVTSGAAYLRK